MEWLKTILGENWTEEIEKAISDQIGNLFVSKERYDQVNEGKKQFEEQLRERDKQLEELKEVAGDAEAMKEKIKALEEENKASQEKASAELEQMKKDWATEKYFEGFEFTSDLAKAAAIQQFKEKELKLEDGKFLGADDFMKELAEKNPTAFVSEEDKKKPVITRPTGGTKSKEKMSLSEAMKYKNEHPDANIDDLI